jgi:hypothetical protein
VKVSGSIFALLLLWTGGHANAASLQLRDHETGKVITGSTISYVWKNDGTKGPIALENYVTVFNASSKSIDVGVKKVEFDTKQADVSHSICFAGLCYPDYVFVSPELQTIAAGASDSGLETGFHGAYNFETSLHTGSIDRMAYIFYDAKNPADSAVVFVNYNTMALASNAILPRGGQLISQARYSADRGRVLFSFPYPEGGSEALKFGLVGMSGERIPLSAITRDRGAISVETRALNSGIYCLSIFAGQRLLGTERFTVGR